MIVCPFKELGRYAAIIPGLEEAMKAIHELTGLDPQTIPLSGGNRIMVQKYTTKDASEGKAEAHRQFLDIQYIVEGEEVVGWANVDTLTPDGDFLTDKDIGFYKGDVNCIRITAGNCYVVFPEDAHMPGIHLDEPHVCTKMVVKLKV